MGPRYLAIADALAKDITEGRLAPGSRLPTHRDLAWHLGVTVGTVTRAYREAERRGLLIGEVGRGTFVREGAAAGNFRIGGDLALAGAGAHCPLHYAAPPPVPATSALAPTLHAIADTPGLTAYLDYPPNEGHHSHRQAAVSWLARHQLEVTPEQVVLTNGAHHAVFAALMALTRPGDRLLVEPLTYPGLLPLARLLDLRLEPVACDNQGLLPDALEATARTQQARALYCIPTLKNPTTTTLSLERRQAIAGIARDLDLAIIEDDIFKLLAEASPPPISRFAPEHGIFITSLSKTIAPGLRVGFLAAAPGRVDALRQAAQTTSGKSSPFPLEIARRWIEDGTAETILGELKVELAERRAIALSVLEGHRLHCPPGAMHLKLDLPEPWQPAELAAAALENGVKISSTLPFAVQPRQQHNAVRLCLGPPRSRDELRAGLERLRAVLDRSPESFYETVV